MYEDDECWNGICNPDDYVGSFTIDRGVCNAEVFASGGTAAWTTEHQATRTGDVSRVDYRLWCSACKNVGSPYCSSGVQL